MKKHQAIYERDILFSTNTNDISVLKVKLYGEKVNNKIVALVLVKPEFDPEEHIEIILSNLESEIFNRININMANNADIIIHSNDKTFKVIFNSEGSSMPFKFEIIDSTEIKDLEY